MVKKNLIFAALLIISPGCASAPVYDKIFSEDNSYNHKTFALSKEELYAATIKTIYAKNFMIDKESEDKDFIVARRSFQKGKKTTILVVQAKIVGEKTAEASTLFLSALETTEQFYVADRTRFFLFIVPLPGGGGKQASTVKQGEKEIEDKNFYKKWFDEIQKEINRYKS